MANGEPSNGKFKLDQKTWDAVRFLIAVIFTAGILYATVQAAVSDIGKTEERLSQRIVTTDKIHDALDSRLRFLEQEQAAAREWREHTKQTLDRIERKIDKERK